MHKAEGNSSRFDISNKFSSCYPCSIVCFDNQVLLYRQRPE